MLDLIIAVILGLASGFGLAWLIIRKLPQEKIREINYERLEAEQRMLEEQKEKERQAIEEFCQKRVEAWHEYDEMRRECDEMSRRISLLTSQKDVLSNDVTHLANQRADIASSLEQSRRDAEYTAKTFLKQQMELAQEQLDRSLEAIAAKYQADEEAYKEQYLETVKEYAKDMIVKMEDLKHDYAILEAAFSELRLNVDTAVASAKRDEEKRQAKNFYRLVLPESDLHEISQLRAVEPFLRDKEALNKVIWKVYYEKPYTDMIGRVIGQGIKTGIYKITNMENQMCYVGQAANVADRWRQHIKRGLGAEAPTRNKLYPAMQALGVENFTFELLEECSRENLDAREDYWQDFFHAKDFGYSIK